MQASNYASHMDLSEPASIYLLKGKEHHMAFKRDLESADCKRLEAGSQQWLQYRFIFGLSAKSFVLKQRQVHGVMDLSNNVDRMQSISSASTLMSTF